MWGQVSAAEYLDTDTGIIPTRVGTSSACNIGFAIYEDHPHACGDKTYFVGNATASLGSSPRVWGQGVNFNHSVFIAGIIPTRVGTRAVNQLRHSLHKDHPHACGDKCMTTAVFVLLAGSSPRVWGQVEQIIEAHAETGIIPTRVGTSRQQMRHV